MGRLTSLLRSNKDSDARALDKAPFVMSFIEHMAVALFVLDREGKVIVWNEACEKLTGLGAREVLGTKDHWKGFYPAQRPCLADLALKGGGAEVSALYAAHDKQASAQGRMKAQNWCDLPRGQRCYLAIDACPIRDSDGQVIAVVETLQNLTAIKEAETAVAAERETQARNLETIRQALGAGLDGLARGDLETRV
jgi:methyl-accepting chemotaxis protein